MTISDPRPWEKYRLAAQSVERENEGHRLGSGSPFAADEPDAPPRSSSRIGRWWSNAGLSTAETTIVIASVLGLIAATVILFRGTGLAQTGIFALIALVPLFLVAWILMRSDRVAPLPGRYLAFAALWGAGVATATAAAVNSAVFADFLGYFGDVTTAEARAAITVAPFSEEILKGLGVALILYVARRFVVSTSGGVVIGGLVGAGFAFTENILYFAQAQTEGRATLGMTIFARAVMSPFVHPLATSMTGIGIAAAILVPGGAWSRIWRIFLGWSAAIAVHALWNGLATLGTAWLLWYLLLEVPIFVAWLIWISRQPRRLLPHVAAGLAPYVATGWLRREEVAMATTQVGRRHGRKWARKISPLARRSMKAYLVDAGRLGLEQQQIERLDLPRERLLVAQASLSEMISNREMYLEQARLAAAEERVDTDD